MSALAWAAWNPDFVLQPLALYVLLAAGLGPCLYLFVTVKAEIHGLSVRCRRERQEVQALQTALAEARLAVAALAADLLTVERQTGMLVAPVAARSGLNLSKRTEVLRMHRAGRDSAGISAALVLPRAEVELLIKVHRMVVEQI